MKVEGVDDDFHPNSNISIKLETELNSFVSVMAVDQKIAFEGSHDIDAEGLKRAFISDRRSVNSEVYKNGAFILTPTLQCNEAEKALLDIQLSNSAAQSGANRPYSMNDQLDYDEPVERVDDEIESEIDTIKPNNPPGEERDEDEVIFRKYFPDVWIYDSFIANETSIELIKKIPDSITTWKLSAFALHPEHGLAIVEPQFIKASKNVYLEVSAPKVVRAGEVFEITFMPMTQSLTPIDNFKVSLSDSFGKFLYVTKVPSNETCFNYTTSEISTPEIVTLGSKGKFLIQMTKEGLQFINVTTQIEYSVVDIVELVIKVIPDGINEHKVTDIFIDLGQLGETFEETASIEVPAGAKLIRAGIDLHGNLLGPAFESFKER